MSNQNLKIGFNTIEKSDNAKWIAFYHDNSVWQANLLGFKALLSNGLSNLLEIGLDKKEANAVAMLYSFMEDLEEELNK